MTPRIDFDAINSVARSALPALVSRWLPDGRREGHDWVARNPCRADRRPGSFRIVLHGAKAGVWKDFATTDGGSDPVSLAAYLFGLSQAEAARRLADCLGVAHG